MFVFWLLVAVFGACCIAPFFKDGEACKPQPKKR